MFATSEYLDRRALLTSKFTTGVLLFLGNEDSPMNYLDNTYHFRQDSNFLYYFGIDAPKLSVVIDIEENKTILFGDEMTIDEIVWMGRQKTLAAKAADSGITHLKPSDELAKYITQVLAMKRQVHYLPPYRAENKIKLADLLAASVHTISEAASLPLIKAIIQQRSVKSATELAELDKACSISADMHLAAIRLASPGLTEHEITAAIQQVATAAGGNLAYPIILTINGQILHNHYHGNTLKEGDLVLNDSGFETPMGYAGDLTRTFPVAKKFTNQQRDLYNLVLAAYHNAVSLLKPGCRYIDVHYAACLTLANGLKELGLMKGNMEEAVREGAHALFFQCGTGHMMGLDVHDMEDLGEQYVGYTGDLQKNSTQFGLKSLRLGKALEEGYVLTVEPGLYFIPELTERWCAEKKFAGFINYDKVKAYNNFGGIRVEDDYVITATGYRKLGKQLSITADDIEQLRAEGIKR